MKVIHLNHRFI